MRPYGTLRYSGILVEGILRKISTSSDVEKDCLRISAKSVQMARICQIERLQLNEMQIGVLYVRERSVSTGYDLF